MEERWTSSGPSAMRSVRAAEYLQEDESLMGWNQDCCVWTRKWVPYIWARGKSPDTPAAPYTCMAQSSTLQAILAAATLIRAI